jgi:leucyl-tRNA synthetase
MFHASVSSFFYISDMNSVEWQMNPYYDAFVKWQMRKLKKLGKVVKDMRYTIYSPLDGQPCADHDRTTGEGVLPQEYVLIKMEVISPFPPKLKSLEGRKVYLAAAILRPETMYGQTNCWVLPDGMYSAFEINDTDVFILTARSTFNLAYQHLSCVPGKPTCLCELSGSDLFGLPLKSPLAFNETMNGNRNGVEEGGGGISRTTEKRIWQLRAAASNRAVSQGTLGSLL